MSFLSTHFPALIAPALLTLGALACGSPGYSDVDVNPPAAGDDAGSGQDNPGGSAPANCTCASNDLDCSNFASAAEAQSCFDTCMEQVGYDVYNLDGDADGVACESLPSSGGGSENSGGSAGSVDGLNYDETATVNFVIDGDTSDVTIAGRDYRIRYLGINTPERDEVCYQEATDAHKALVPPGATVYLVKDVSNTDRFDRLLRYVYLMGQDGLIFVNELMVADGWAEAVVYPPDDAFYDYFLGLEAAAKSAGRGCHPTGIFDD
jgi:endonuclease YncB( thermonuclease family)